MSLTQTLGTRPPGLPPQVRGRSEWERLRREIYRRGMRFGEQLSFDFRELLTDAGNARDAGVLMWEMLRDLRPEVLLGPGFGATPLLYTIALAALADGVNLQILMVRDRRKGHNQKRWVEGHRPSAEGKRAVVIDDFMRAGSALPLVEKALAADKVKLDIQCVALFFDMWEPLGSRQISVAKYPVLSLFTRHDVGLSRDCFDAVPPLMKGRAPDFIAVDPVWWRFNLNHDIGYPTKCAPIIHGGGAFAADDSSRLWRHDLRTGEVDWCVDSLARPPKGVVQLLQAVDDSLVYGCYDGTVTRVDAASGDIIWRWRIDSSIHATPWVDLGSRRLFINTEQWNGGRPTGHLQCLDWDSGLPCVEASPWLVATRQYSPFASIGPCRCFVQRCFTRRLECDNWGIALERQDDRPGAWAPSSARRQSGGRHRAGLVALLESGHRTTAVGGALRQGLVAPVCSDYRTPRAGVGRQVASQRF